MRRFLKWLGTTLVALLILKTLGAREPSLNQWDSVIKTKDGHHLRGSFWLPADASRSPQGVPAVILVPDLGNSRDSWRDLPQKLMDKGFAVLAMSLRGHDSRSSNKKPWYHYEAKDFQKMTQDIMAARAWLEAQRGINIQKITLVGDRFGANVGLNAMKEDASIKAAFCLSPGFNYRSVRVDQNLAEINNRPLYFVAAAEDSYSSRCLQTFKEAGAQIKIYESEPSDLDHGAELLVSRKPLAQELIRWLQKVL